MCGESHWPAFEVCIKTKTKHSPPTMKKIIGIGLLAGGIVMLVFGLQSKDSLESKFKQTFQGSPSNRTTWLLVGGAASSAAGVALVFLKEK